MTAKIISIWLLQENKLENGGLPLDGVIGL